MVITPPPPIPENNTKKPSQVSATVCTNCGTTTTPLWRRAPNGETICNACGLYLKARKTLRPTVMKRATKQSKVAVEKPTPVLGTCPGDGQCNGKGGSSSCAGCPAFNQTLANRNSLICANCRTTTTPLWRRDEAGNTICNACGLYYKLHNVHRPVSMKRSVIKRRKRIIMAECTDENSDEQYELDSTSSSSNDDDDNDDEEQQPETAERKEKRRIVTKPPKKP
ncbi:glucocorticoid receptor-like (DNA-binding domain), partial [Backusella circina FSU 941]